MKLTTALASLCMAALVSSAITGCASGNQIKGKARKGIAQQDLVPLQYPRSDMVVGTLGWGSPKDAIRQTRPASQTVSDTLLEAIEPIDAAWITKTKGSEVFLSLAADPAPEIIKDLQIAAAEAEVSFDRSKMKFQDFGTLTEKNIDLDRLSRAVIRGWYNMPGESLSIQGLSAMRPDLVEYDLRPWIVQRSIQSEGMKFGVEKEMGAKLATAASGIAMGEASQEVGFRFVNDTMLEVGKPMTIGMEAYVLESVDPPLPTLQTATAGNLASHNFTWRSYVEGKGKAVTYNIDARMLQTVDRRDMMEDTVAVEATNVLTQTVQQGAPIPVSVLVESRPQNDPSASWRPHGEGSTFRSDELVRLRVYLAEPGHLYIMTKDSFGRAAVLYPQAAGQPLSNGTDSTLPEGEFLYPSDTLGMDGMTYAADPKGTETFVVIASEDRLPGLTEAMADFADDITAEADAGNIKTRSSIGLTDLNRTVSPASRIPKGFGNATTQQEAESGFVYSGLGNATVVTVNLTRLP